MGHSAASFTLYWAFVEFNMNRPPHPHKRVRHAHPGRVNVPILITEWCNDIPFDCRCSMVESWCVQVTPLLPLGLLARE